MIGTFLWGGGYVLTELCGNKILNLEYNTLRHTTSGSILLLLLQPPQVLIMLFIFINTDILLYITTMVTKP